MIPALLTSTSTSLPSTIPVNVRVSAAVSRTSTACTVTTVEGAQRVERVVGKPKGVHVHAQANQLGGDRPTDPAGCTGDDGAAIRRHRSLHSRRAS